MHEFQESYSFPRPLPDLDSEQLTPTQQTPVDTPQISYLEAFLATRFDECNIASADACKHANSRAETDTTRADYYVVNPFNEVRLQPNSVTHLGTVPIDSSLTHEKEVNLMLEGNSTDIDGKPRPRILAVFNNDIALPIAAFARRNGGQCSYVQLGQEMEVDDLVVTSRDIRSNYVEAIRALLKNKITPAGSELISDLVQQELIRHQQSVEMLLEPSLSRAAFSYFNTRKDKGLYKQFKILESLGGIADPVPMLYRDISDHTRILINERPVRFLLTRERQQTETTYKRAFRRPRIITTEGSTGNLHLLATTRDNLGVSLMQFTPEGKALLTTADTATGEEALKPLSIEETVEIRKYLSYEFNFERVMNIHSELIKKAHAKMKELNWDDVDNKSYKYVNAEENKKAAEQAQSDTQCNLINSRNTLVSITDITNRFNGFLGEFNPDQESLLKKLGELTLTTKTEYSGVLKDESSGKTKSDVDFFVDITPLPSGAFGIEVLARPSPLEDVEPEALFSEIIYVDKPNTQPAYMIAEMAKYLGKICTKK